MFDEQRFPDDPTVYVNIPSRTDPTVAPAGGETLFIMANAPAVEGARWDTENTEQAWMHVHNRLLSSGFPNLEGHMAFRESWTPARFAERYAMPGGAIYGTASHSWKSAFLRPANRDRRLRGLYYVGGSSHPGGGTPMVLLSAKITTRLIAGDGYA
jgi:phytoene desaturase